MEIVTRSTFLTLPGNNQKHTTCFTSLITKLETKAKRKKITNKNVELKCSKCCHLPYSCNDVFSRTNVIVNINHLSSFS